MKTTAWTSEEFRIMYTRNVDEVFAFLARRLGPDDAEELTAQTFFDAWAVRHRYRVELGTEAAWLYGIALNHMRHHFRDDTRQDRAYQAFAGRNLHTDDEFQEDDLVDRIDAERRWRAVAHLIDRMTPNEREVFVLYALGQLTYQEIATRLDIPVGTVRSRLSRCRARITPDLPLAIIEAVS